LAIVPPASAPVNYLTITGAATGNPVAVGVSGSDTNIDLRLVPKGSGRLRFGAYTALASEVLAGYITVKSDDGTTRKLAVIA
jgi:hypothetical protein